MVCRQQHVGNNIPCHKLSLCEIIFLLLHLFLSLHLRPSCVITANTRPKRWPLVAGRASRGGFHTAALSGIRHNPVFNEVATADVEGTLCVWNATTGTWLYNICTICTFVQASTCTSICTSILSYIHMQTLIRM